MIVGAAFVPQAPVLVPDIAQGAAPELDDLRAACRAAIRRVAPPGVTPIVIGSGPTWASFGPTSRGTFAGFGLPMQVPLGCDEPGPLELPPALTLGAWLVRDALGPNSATTGVSAGADDPRLHIDNTYLGPPDEDRAFVVVGDGSARRSEKAPGHFDQRAAGVDAWIADVLASGEGLDLDLSTIPEDPEELLVGGAPAWTAAHGDLEIGPWDAELIYDAAPYGVGYFVAAWTRPTARPQHG